MRNFKTCASGSNGQLLTQRHNVVSAAARIGSESAPPWLARGPVQLTAEWVTAMDTADVARRETEISENGRDAGQPPRR